MQTTSHIYKITNTVNGKAYIGFTSKKKPEGRWSEHKRLSIKKGSGYSILHKAIEKYGEGAFEFEVIYQSWDAEHCLRVMEPEFIQQYDTFGDNGYNVTLGGEGQLGRKLTPEHIEILKTRVYSQETRELMAAAKRGTKQSEEHRNAISKAHKGKIKSPEHLAKFRKPCSDEKKAKIRAAQQNPITINGVSYLSLNDAADSLNIPRTTFKRHLKQGKYGNA